MNSNELTPNQQNILAMYLQASATELFEGSHWYQKANLICFSIARKYDVPVIIVAGVIAALSPRNRWERNVNDAEALISAHAVGINPNNIKVSTFNANKQKAVKILTNAHTVDEVTTTLNGRKMVSFFSNILYPNEAQHVTVDGHAVHVWLGVRYALEQAPKVTESLYTRISEDYKTVAKHLGILPNEVQAVTWCTYRNLPITKPY